MIAYHLDGSASVWDVRAGTQLHTLQLHDGQPAFKTQLVGGRLVTSSLDGIVAAWNWKTGLLVWKQQPRELDTTTISRTKIENGVFALKVWNRKVIAGTRDGRLCIWDLDSGYVLSLTLFFLFCAWLLKADRTASRSQHGKLQKV